MRDHHYLQRCELGPHEMWLMPGTDFGIPCTRNALSFVIARPLGTLSEIGGEPTVLPDPHVHLSAGDYVMLQQHWNSGPTVFSKGQRGRIAAVRDTGFVLVQDVKGRNAEAWVPCFCVHPLSHTRQRTLQSFDATTYPGGYLGTGVGEYVTIEVVEGEWAWGYKLVRRLNKWTSQSGGDHWFEALYTSDGPYRFTGDMQFVRWESQVDARMLYGTSALDANHLHDRYWCIIGGWYPLRIFENADA